MPIFSTTLSTDRTGSILRRARRVPSNMTEVASSILFAPVRFYKNRRLQHTMAGMSDHELSDIGLTRQDAIDTTALPLSAEVGTFLSMRAGERRRHR